MDQNGVLFFQNQDIFSKYFCSFFELKQLPLLQMVRGCLDSCEPQIFVFQIFMFSRL